MTPAALAFEDRLAAIEDVETQAAESDRVWVRQSDKLARLISLTPSSDHKGLPDEVGCALSLSRDVAQRMLDVAWELRAQSRVRQAVLDGRLNRRQAEVVLDELCCVDPAIADRILDALFAAGGAVSLRPEQLRRWLNKRTTAADPEGARKKRVLAEREETGVRYRALRDGLAQKIVTGPAIEVRKSMRHLDALTPPRCAEDDRTRGQLLFATEVGAIGYAAAAHGVLPVPVELELETPAIADGYALTPHTKHPEPVQIRTDLAGLAAAVEGTALEGMFRDQAGTPDLESPSDAGRAPADPHVASRVRSHAAHVLAELERRKEARHRAQGLMTVERRLEELIARREWTTVEIAGRHDPDDGDHGQAGSGGTGPHRPSDDSPTGICSDAEGTDSTSPSGRDVRASDTDAADAADAADGADSTDGTVSTGVDTDADGPALRPLDPSSVPVLAGHGPIDPALLRRHLTELTVRRLFVEPLTGVCAVDATTLDLTQIASAAIAQPPPRTIAYAPTVAIKRVVRARYVRCSFPGCGCPARDADLDHRVAFDEGGETTVANLHPLCRRHHQVKQRGWTVTATPDGTSEWTSPLGKKYRSTPGEQ